VTVALGSLRAGAPVVSAETFESQGTRRRAQIIAIATKLIVTEGVDAVNHAVVAEHAGLVRTAVYRYYPSRDDLLAAVAMKRSVIHAARITSEEATAGLLALRHGRPSRMPRATRVLLERLWDPEDWTSEGLEMRLAAVILVQDRALMSRLQSAYPELAAQQSTERDAPLAQLGLTALEARIVSDEFMVAHYHATVAALAGEIDRAEAIRLTYRSNLAAVRAFLD
jgi:AcrR family transcriptional regulator